MTYQFKARLLLAGAAFATMSLPALALDGNDLVGKINKALAVQGGAGLTAETVSVNGSDVTANNAKFVVGDGKQSLPIGTIKFLGVVEDSGSYTVEKVSFDNVNITEDKANFTASDISISGLAVPANPEGKDLQAVMLYDEAHVGKIVNTVDGKQGFSIDNLAVTTELADDNSSVAFSLEANGIKSDLSLVDDADSKDAIQQLGLAPVDGKMTLEGSWAVADGTLDLTEYALDLKNVGRLAMSFSLTGYTLDFIKSLNETTKTMSAQAGNQEAQQAAGLAMLGLMQQLSFNSAEIRFEDAGVTKKGVEYAAKKQGKTAAEFTQILKGMTPVMMAQLNLPDLQNMVSSAVNAYLDKPGNFTITAEPDNAVPFPMIIGAAMGAPNTLPKVLGVTVSAND